MDWSDERYVRIYVRDTKTWKLLGWEGQTVLCLLARRFDRAGLLDDVRNGEDVALMIGSGFPVDVAERGLQRLIDKGVMELVDAGLFWPKFMEAQEATQSDKQRQRECRARRREKARLDNMSQNVTKTTNSVTSGHEVSQPVTPCCTVPSLTSSVTGEDTRNNTRKNVSTKDVLSLTPRSSSDLTSEKGTGKSVAKGAATWAAYSTAYAKRYGVAPARSKSANIMCCNLVKAIGEGDAPHVAAYYLTSNNSYYIQRGHSLNVLVADANKLRTEWLTGCRVTQSQARQADRLQGQGDGWAKIIREKGE